MSEGITLRPLTRVDRDQALSVINTAAGWYREFLPDAAYDEPEMTAAAWTAEAKRLGWHGAFQADTLVGVMGLEYVNDVALLRHAYILPDAQRRGVGRLLMQTLERQVTGVGRIVVGTYAGNYKARGMLEKSGYRLSGDSTAVLRQYYDIPDDRLWSSVTYEKEI